MDVKVVGYQNCVASSWVLWYFWDRMFFLIATCGELILFVIRAHSWNCKLLKKGGKYWVMVVIFLVGPQFYPS
jgi:hypothetical protein